MKSKSAILVMILALYIAAPKAARSQSDSTSGGNPEFRKGEVVVEIKPGASIDAINARYGTTVIQRIYGTNLYRLATPRMKKEKKFRKRLANDPDVLSASLNEVVASISLFGRAVIDFPFGNASPGKTSDEYKLRQELIDLLKLEDVKLRSKGRGVIVAVIDTGVSASHPDLAPRLWKDRRDGGELEGAGIDNDGDGLVNDFRGWDFIDNDNDPTELPDNPETTVAGHGTFIAGLITLIAPDSIILPIRAFPADGVGDAFTVASAIKYAADHGAKVINLSLGSSEVSTLLQDAITYARERGAVIVAAVGNEDKESPAQFPSSSADVMAVTAVDAIGRKASFSNFGGHVDVAAPGVELVSTYPGRGSANYAIWSGTSFAAPLAAAEAALLFAVDPNNREVKKDIEDSALNIDGLNPGFAGKLGKGLIDPLKALQDNLSALIPTKDVHAEIALVRGAGIVDARGRAEISIVGTKQEFEVEAYNLSVRTQYTLVVNDSLVVPLGTTNLGDVRIKLSTEPGHRPLPESLNPVTKIKHIQLRDAQGRVWLEGEFTPVRPGPTPVGQSVKKEAQLVSTGLFVQARGKARIEVDREREKLRIEADGLTPGATYRIVVDGINLELVAAVRLGYLQIEFTSDSSSGSFLPPQLRPATNIRRVEVRDLTGQIILQGGFRPGVEIFSDFQPPHR